jgi:hypothetical protein
MNDINLISILDTEKTSFKYEEHSCLDNKSIGLLDARIRAFAYDSWVQFHCVMLQMRLQ